VGIVTATGAHTEIGRIQALVSDAGSLATPLTKQLDRFGKVLTLVILGMAAVMMLIGRYLHQMPFPELISATIGFAVAAIPRVCPRSSRSPSRSACSRWPAGTPSRASSRGGGARFGHDGVLRQDRHPHEERDDGRTMVTPVARYEVSGLGYDPSGEITPAGGRDLAALLAVADLCNDAEVVRADGGGWTLVGEPTEGALKSSR
jgi:magnesium-transporting ATPase (P-type)